MPIESELFVAGVGLMFAVFLVALAWAERQTRGLEANDVGATHPAE